MTAHEDGTRHASAADFSDLSMEMERLSVADRHDFFQMLRNINFEEVKTDETFQERVRRCLHVVLTFIQKRLLVVNSISNDNNSDVWVEASETEDREKRTDPHEDHAEVVMEITTALIAWSQQVLPLSLWLQWMEVACSLSMLRRLLGIKNDAVEQVDAVLEGCVASPLPTEFPTQISHCAQQQQIEFSCQLWDAVVSKSLKNCPDADIGRYEAIMSWLMQVFTHWIARAMQGYELVFVSNVGLSLVTHIQKTAIYPMVQHVAINFAASQAQLGVEKNAVGMSIGVFLVTAYVSIEEANHSDRCERFLVMLRGQIIEKMKTSEALPQPHDPTAIVAMALGIAAFAAPQDINHPSQRPSWTRTLVQQFALLRSVNLPLLSFRLILPSNQITTFCDVTQRGLHAAMKMRDYPDVVNLSYRMQEAAVTEALTYFRSSPAHHLSLVEALRTVLPQEIFRNVVNNYISTQRQNISASEIALSTEVLAYLKNLYVSVASTLHTLLISQPNNYDAQIRSFLMLSKLEFARESCSTQEINTYMNHVTQQIEDHVEGSPEKVLSTIFQSVSPSLSALWPTDTTIPHEVDIIFSCQALVVGLIIQRKLRVVLFQSPALLDDALAIIFDGIYNGYEPLDTFAHRFIGFCLTHLTQFVSIYKVFPYYLQVTLAQYPENASREAMARALGSIFGALYYSNAPASSSYATTVDEKSHQQTLDRMILWGMKKCSDRIVQLVLADEPEADVQSADPSEKNTVNTRKSNGVYLAGLLFEIMKMSPLYLVPQGAMEIELLLLKCAEAESVLHELKQTLFTSISQNCEAEKRAWLAAWYIEVNLQYPTTRSLLAKEDESIGDVKHEAEPIQSKL